MKITRRTYPSEKGKIEVFRLENSHGAWVELSNVGAGIVGVGVPDREGKIENVALGYADPADYLYDGPCMGKTAGRYANRIAGGHLVVEGKEYRLAVNNGPNHLHGGPEGFQNQLWEARETEDGVEFRYVSADGEENYPGELTSTVRYRWNDSDELTLEIEARTDAPTVVNLTNHTYWNLGGADSGKALNHELKMKASRWLPTDATLVPSGELAEVAGTPMDFTRWKAAGAEIKEDFPALRYGKGYDNCWAIDGWAPGVEIRGAVELRDPACGRYMVVDSDQPGVQVYTGNWLSGSAANRSGHGYEDYDGVAIEMQGFPDAPNHPEFPSQLLLPGETYRRVIRYRFLTE